MDIRQWISDPVLQRAIVSVRDEIAVAEREILFQSGVMSGLRRAGAHKTPIFKFETEELDKRQQRLSFLRDDLHDLTR